MSNWILAEELARAHHEALLQAAANERLSKQARRGREHGFRRALGVRLVRAGLAVAAGVRAARSAPEVVGAAMCGEAPASR